MITGGERIALMAEDHDGYRARVAAIVRAAGLRPIATADGAEAIALIEARVAADLLVTDLEMPNRDGWAVIDAWLAAGRPLAAVLLVTGEADRRDVRERCASAGIRLIHKIALDARLPSALVDALTAIRGTAEADPGR